MEIANYNIGIENFTLLHTKSLEEKIDNKDNFLLYTGRVTCQWCRKLVPVLYEIADEKNIEVFYLDSQDSEINTELKNFRDKYKIDMVPSLIFFDEENYSQLDLDITAKSFNKLFLVELIDDYLK